MKRRDFLKTGALAAAAAPALAAPALAQATLNLKMAGGFPRGFPGVGTGAEKLAKRIEAMSDGKVKITYYGGGELVPPFEVFGAVSSGAADMGHTASYYHAGKVRAAMYYTTVPYGLEQSELSGWIAYGGGQALWDEAYAPFGVKPFYAGGSGAQAGGWFKNPVTKLDDLAGLKMRIAGLGGDVMRKLGVVTVLTPPPEIYPALQSGVVDAAEFVGPWNDVALGLYKIAPYYYLPAFHEPGAALEMIINQNVWGNMSPSLQAIFASAAQAQGEDTIAEFRYNNTRVLADLVSKGAKVSAFPDDVVAALGKASREVLDAYPKGDAVAEKVHASYVDYIKQCASYTKAMEERMYHDRAAVWGV